MQQSVPDAVKKLPAYTIAEAARYIGVNASTVQNWFRGNNPVLSKSKGLVSFIDLVQAHVLHTIRKGYHIPMKRVRIAAETLEKISGSLDCLAHQDFYHDHRDLFLRLDEGLVSLSERGQFVNKEIIEGGLRQLAFGNDGFTEWFYPRANGELQEAFAINPSVNYGKLCISRLGVGVDSIRDRFLAGEGIKDIAEDYGAECAEVEEAIRWHDRLAA